MRRRIIAGIADNVERLQPAEPPAFTQELVGKRIEVLWKYHLPNGEATLIWAPGRIVRVADGLTNTRSARGKKILPAGAVLWEWQADAAFGETEGQQWLILLPTKWNRHVHYGWRFDPCELVSAAGSAEATPRPRKAQRSRD